MNLNHYNIIGRGKLGQIVFDLMSCEDTPVISTSKGPRECHQNFIYELGDTLPLPITKDSAATLITLPPSASDDLKLWQKLAKQLASYPNVYYTSSIGALKAEKKHLIEIENIFIENNIRVLRLGGIIFKGKHPINFLQNRELKNSLDPVNLIHANDIAKIIVSIMKRPSMITKEIHYIVAPEHPTKKDYYRDIAHKLSLNEPLFDTSTSKAQRIDCDIDGCTDFNFKSLYQLD